MLPRLAVFPLALALTACSPALNWREVRLEQLTATLPCKPDQARRNVRLAARDVAMEMAGCEASGFLFAVSHVRVDDATQSEGVQAQWRQLSLTAMRASSVQELPFELARRLASTRGGQAAIPDTGTVVGVHLLAVLGQRPDGSAIRARLLWLRSGTDIYHAAVYGDALGDEATEPFFSGLGLR